MMLSMQKLLCQSYYEYEYIFLKNGYLVNHSYIIRKVRFEK